MATQPDNQDPSPESRSGGEGDGGIGAGTLATAGLGLIALAILIWFIYPRFTGTSQTTEKTPGTVIAELVTATPLPMITATTVAPTQARGETPTPPPVTASPTAIPVTPTPTLPAKVQEGVYAKVVGTEIEGLSFRSGPGLDYVRWRILPEGEIVKVTGGPQEVDGVIWWRVVDKTGLVGWASEQFLVPVEPPAWTPEPERTPDLTELTPTPES